MQYKGREMPNYKSYKTLEKIYMIHTLLCYKKKLKPAFADFSLFFIFFFPFPGYLLNTQRILL